MSLVALTALLLLSLLLLLLRLFVPLTSASPLASVLLAVLSSAVPTMPMQAEVLQGPVVLTALVQLLSVLEATSSATSMLSEVVTPLPRLLLLLRPVLRLELLEVVDVVLVMLMCFFLVLPALVALSAPVPAGATSLCMSLAVAAELLSLETTIVDEFWS